MARIIHTSVADKLLTQIDAAFDQIGDTPEIGFPVEDIKPGIRCKPVKRNYLIFYQIIGDEVFILLTLMDSAERLPVAGKVIWVTPSGAQNKRTQGIGVQFSDQDGGDTQKKIETTLAGGLNADRPTHTMSAAQQPGKHLPRRPECRRRAGRRRSPSGSARKPLPNCVGHCHSRQRRSRPWTGKAVSGAACTVAD